MSSPRRSTRAGERAPLRIGLVQERWHPDPEEHQEALARGIRLAASEGASIVCLQELTLSPYFAATEELAQHARTYAEKVHGGPTLTMAKRLAADYDTVLLRATIRTDGEVHEIEIVSGNPILAESALRAVRQWRYRPTLLDGEAVEVETEITVNFVLGRY